MQLLQDQVLRDQVLRDQALHDEAGGAHWSIPLTAIRTVVTAFSTLVSMAVYLSYVPVWALRSMGRTTSKALESRPVLLTMLLVLGVLCGLAIAALLSRDPREATAYAVACLMIGGAIAVGDRVAGISDRAVKRGSLVRASDVQVADASVEAEREMQAVAHDLRGPLLTVSMYLDLI